MAMGIFEQLASLTKKVNRLCCAVQNQGLKSTSIDVSTLITPDPEYIITGDGIYQFYGTANAFVNISFPNATSAGQTMYIVNASNDILQPFSNVPLQGGTAGDFTAPIPASEIYQLLSMEDFANPGSFIWRAYKVY